MTQSLKYLMTFFVTASATFAQSIPVDYEIPAPIKVEKKQEKPAKKAKSSRPTLTTNQKQQIESYKQQINSNLFLLVDSSTQQMMLINRGRIFRQWPVSTSKYGLGSRAGSNKTPTGLHYIHSKLGDKVPFGGILKARQYIGREAKILTDKTDTPHDHVTTRIMWLKGMEAGKNSGPGIDSFRRYIYIHGTPEEGLIGQPASMGCIRMKNKDVIELYKMARTGMKVLIL